MKKICFFGIYDREYPRNKVIISGFEENGYQIVHCNVNPRVAKGWRKYKELGRLVRPIKGEDFEMIWVAFPGHTCVWLAKFLFRQKPIVFDVFISQYEANVSDRKVHGKWSFLGLKDWFLDWHSVRLADIVTIDTNEQIKLFERKYGLDQNKAIRIFLSSALSPRGFHERAVDGKFLVHFHGSFIPLHGVEYIVRAAKLLEHDDGIVFRLVGGGQQLKDMKALAESLGIKNIEFTGRVQEYADVLKYLDDSDMMLGMFAASGRGHWIIPNKIFEGMVYGKAIITADTPAMRELFTDMVNVLFCTPGSPEDIAAKITFLKNDKILREKLGRGALELFRTRLSPKALVAEFLTDLKQKL